MEFRVNAIMKKTTFFIYFLFLSFFCLAQNETELDSVYIEGGQLVTGYLHEHKKQEYVLLESEYNQIIKLESGVKVPLAAGELAHIDYENIERVIENQILLSPSEAKNRLHQSGPYMITSMGFSMSYGSVINRVFSTSRHLNFIVGQQWSPHLFTGLGIASDLYEIELHSTISFIPIYVEGIYLFRKKAFTPYISLAVGYGIAHKARSDFKTSSHNGGWMLNPKIGIKVPTMLIQGLFLYGGYKIQDSYVEQETLGSFTSHQKLLLRRFELGMGLLF